MLGEAAHIKAARPGGARYDPAQSEKDRHSAENGLWLCERCAALIDKNGGADFSIDELKLWKVASERAALERVYHHSDVVRDNCVQSLIYINIPRLHHYVALTRQSDIPTFFDDGIPGEGYIAPELHGLERAIANLRFPALSWQDASSILDDPTGILVSFEGQFRTRNGPRERRDRAERDLSDLARAPQIYQRSGDLKLILPYDPKFVTTSTAMVELTSGQTRVGGFALIKQRVDNSIVASPFIIGLWSSPEGRAIMDAMRQTQRKIWMDRQ